MNQVYFSLSFIDLITVTFIENNVVKNLDTVIIVKPSRVHIGRLENIVIPSDIIDTAIQYLHLNFQELLGILVPV